MFGFLNRGRKADAGEVTSYMGPTNGLADDSVKEPVAYSSQAAAALAAAAASQPAHQHSGPTPTGRAVQGSKITFNIDEAAAGEAAPELKVAPITMLKNEFKLDHSQQIAANSSYICYGLKAGHIRVLNKHTASRQLFKGHTQPLTDIAFFSKDSNMLASCSGSGDVFVRNIIEAETDGAPSEVFLMRAQLPAPQPGAMLKLAWHPVIPQILAVAAGPKVHIFMVPVDDPPQQDSIPLTEPGMEFPSWHPGRVATALAFSPDGGLLAVADDMGTVTMRHLEGGEDESEPGHSPVMEWEPFPGYQDNKAVAFMFFLGQTEEGGSCIVTGDATNQTLKLWSIPKQLPQRDATQLQTISFESNSGPGDFFNHVAVDTSLQLIIVANAARKQVYTLHYSTPIEPHGKAMAPLKAVDYIAMFSVRQAILSLTTSVESSESEITPGVAESRTQLLLYCVQTDAIQQYSLDPALCSLGMPANVQQQQQQEASVVELSKVAAHALPEPAVSQPSAAPTVSVTAVMPADNEPAAAPGDVSAGLAPSPEDITKPPQAPSLPSVTPKDMQGLLAAAHGPLSPGSSISTPMSDLQPPKSVAPQSAPSSTSVAAMTARPGQQQPLLPATAPQSIATTIGDLAVPSPGQLPSPMRLLHPADAVASKASQAGQSSSGSSMPVDAPMQMAAAATSDNVLTSQPPLPPMPTTLAKQSSLGHTQAADSANSNITETAPPSALILAPPVAAAMPEPSSSTSTVASSTVPAPPAAVAVPEVEEGEFVEEPAQAVPATVELVMGHPTTMITPAPATADVGAAQLAAIKREVEQLAAMQRALAAQISAGQQEVLQGVKAELGKNLRSTENSLGNKVEQMLKVNSKRNEEDRRKSAVRERQELEISVRQQINQAVAKLIQDLSKTMTDVAREQSRTAVQTTTNAIAPAVTAAVSSTVTTAVQKALREAVAAELGAANGPLHAAIERAVVPQLQSALTKPLYESLRDNFQSSLIPAFERATQVMFAQIESAFSAWLQDNMKAASGATAEVASSLKASVSQLQALSASMQQEVLEGQKQLSRMASSSASSSDTRALSLAQLEAQQQDPKAAIKALLAAQNYEAAFSKALSLADVDIVTWLCRQMDSNAIASAEPCPVSQPVLLSLVQQLSADMRSDAELKLEWLADMATLLNPQDPMVAPHMKTVLNGTLSKLKSLVSSLPMADPMAKKGKLTIHLINSLLHQ